MSRITDRYLSRSLVIEPFQDKSLLRDFWGESWGVSNPVGRIKKVLMHRPGREILRLHEHADRIEAGPLLSGEVKGKVPRHNRNPGPPDLEVLAKQHDALAEALAREGVEVIGMDQSEEHWPEQLFTRDLGMVVPGGVILSRFALYIRYGESAAASRAFNRIGIPQLGTVQGHGFAEGGSFIMLDPETAVIGRSERVNQEGIRQIRQILSIQGIRLLAIDLPSTIIHLDEAFLMVDRRKALVNTALLPFRFLDELHRRDIELLHVDPRDHDLVINALTVAPGKVLFAASGERTLELLVKHGIDVIPVEVSEIFKLGGGIHCVTLPLLREDME